MTTFITGMFTGVSFSPARDRHFTTRRTTAAAAACWRRAGGFGFVSDGEGDATSAHDPGDRFGSRVCVLQACSAIEAFLRVAWRAGLLFVAGSFLVA